MKSRRWIALGLLVIFGLAGCATSGGDAPPTSIPLDETFPLQPGKTATVSSDNIQVTFVRVTEDSRCPTDVQCAWAGRAVIEIQVSPSGGGPGTAQLTLGEASSATFGDYTVEIRDLDPTPVSTDPIRPGAYVATLVVTK